MSMNAPQIALFYAKRGWPVFPCNPENKSPLVAGGFKSATTDEAVIWFWWTQHPNAMIGIPTGVASGLAVLDVDVKNGHDGVASLKRLGQPPTTWTVKTPSGGLHYIFKYDPQRPLSNSIGKLGDGLDVRGEGGYIIAAASVDAQGRAYSTIEHAEPAIAPDWLYGPRRPISERATEGLRLATALEPSAIKPADSQAAFTREVDGVRCAVPGTRNQTLNNAAFKLGQFVGVGALGLTECEQALTEAANACGLIKDDGLRAVIKTINSGLTAGIAKPRVIQNTQALVANDEAVPLIEAKPFVWKPASQAPKRQWLYGSFLMRGTLALTVAPGGVGKSMLSIVEALSMATGHGKLHDFVHRRCRVWLFNLEDSDDELERRFLGACKLYSIGKPNLEGYLFVNSGHGTPLVIAHQDKNGLTIAKPVVEALMTEITSKGVDVVIIDPFVSCHQANENDNNAIDAVAKTWAAIANRTGCAIHLVHHSRKTNGGPVDVEDSRGASALMNAVRSARALNPMTKSQAQEAGIEDGHWSFVQISDGKANFAPRADKSKWFKLESVDLGNGGLGNLELGDRVGVPVTWSWPEPTKLSDVDRVAILKHLETAGPWRKDQQAKAWVGYGVIAALKLDPENKAHKAQARSIIVELLESEALVIMRREDEKRNMRDFVVVAS